MSKAKPKALDRLIADYRTLAFPEEDAVVRRRREEFIANAVSEDARRFVATEDLLAACKLALVIDHEDCEEDEWEQMKSAIRAAIAKATSEASP